MRVGTIGETDEERLALGRGEVAQPFFDVHFGPMLARTINVAAKLRLFDPLAGGRLTLAELSRRLQTDEAATAKLLNALAAGGYVALEGERYALTPVARRWLVSDSPLSVVEYVAQIDRNEWRWAEHYEEYVRTGRSMNVHRLLDEEQWRLYQRGMHVLARASADELAAKLPLAPDAVLMLDLGGSHGLFSVAACRRRPALEAIVVDLPAAVRAAAPLLAAEGMGDRVVHHACDVMTYDFRRDSVDLVLISHLAHHLSDEQNRLLLRRVATALRPGGSVVVQEGVRPADASQAGQVALLLDLFCASTSASGTWSVAEIRRWQDEAGLEARPTILLDSAPGIAAVPARKAGA
jgi:SAM-dependent methyltransferase